MLDAARCWAVRPSTSDVRKSTCDVRALELLVKVSVGVGLLLGTLRVGNRRGHQALLFCAIHEILIEPLLLLGDQSFLEGHLVLRVKHFSLLLQIIRLIVVLAELLVIILQLLHFSVLLFFLLASLPLQIVASEVV